jgi:hypothetical protein
VGAVEKGFAVFFKNSSRADGQGFYCNLIVEIEDRKKKKVDDEQGGGSWRVEGGIPRGMRSANQATQSLLNSGLSPCILSHRQGL